MSLFGTVLADLIFFMVREQTCSCSYKMDKSLWQTSSTWSRTFITHANSDSIVMRETQHIKCRLGLFQDSDFAGDLEDSKINIRWTLMHFRKSNICANKLDVEETDITFTQLNRRWGYFSGCWFPHGRNYRAWPLGLRDWSISFLTKPNWQTQGSSAPGNPVAKHHTPHEKPQIQPSTTIWISMTLIRFLPTWDLLIECYAVCLWGQWSCD